MTIFVFILIAIFVVVLGFGVTVWFIFRRRLQFESQEPAKETPPSESLPFHWSYITAPLVILLLSIILSAIFYPRLPAEVGYHFGSDGIPDRWLSREMALVLMLVPQILMTILAAVILRVVSKFGIISSQSESLGIKPQRILFLMGNIAVLPQLVLGFTMLDIFIYNACQIHLMPMWVFLLILGLSTIVLGVILVVFILKARKRLFQQPEEQQ